MFIRTLYRLGINCYASGKICSGRNIYGHYYKISSVSTEQLQELQKLHKGVISVKAQKEFAPEIVSKCLIVRTAAQLKRDKITSDLAGLFTMV